MLTSTGNIIVLLITSVVMNILLIYLLNKKKPTQIHKIFITMCILMLFWLIELILQATCSNILNINPIYFEYLVYINACFIPVCFFVLSAAFANTKFKFNGKSMLLFLVPILSLLVLWTNDFHHLFYVKYSTIFTDTIYGFYFYIHTIYSYLLIAIGLVSLIKYSVKNSGFFSNQSILIMLGALIPVVINILGTFGIIKMSIYITPLSFAIAIFFFALAIFKFDFLKVAPIALQRIVDRISDAYIVVDDNHIISDFNKTFLDLFNVKASDIRNRNISDLFNSYENFEIDADLINSSIINSKQRDDTIVLEEHFNKINKYFHIEINSITNDGNFLGTLLLFKDITQHTVDMQTIKNNQDMLVEKERLASLGQMIGGIAHNLKTPIMSIAGAAEGLSDLIKEYDLGIEDSDVTTEDHHEIAGDMKEWIDKIKTHLSYMSDVITAIKGQAVAFSDQTSTSFTVKELINYVDILMKHELKNGLVNLKTQADIDTLTKVNGNINSLVQVINNIISNAIQAYQSKGTTNQDINLNIYKENENLVFKIQDFAGGLPEKVQQKLFKEMVTTKGKNGTGLGLFMSYSNIKAHFSGSLKYETEKGKGTTFYINIPM